MQVTFCVELLTYCMPFQNYAETAEVFEEMHVERLFLFAVVWSFGSLLQEPDRSRFSDFIKSLTKWSAELPVDSGMYAMHGLSL